MRLNSRRKFNKNLITEKIYKEFHNYLLQMEKTCKMVSKSFEAIAKSFTLVLLKFFMTLKKKRFTILK